MRADEAHDERPFLKIRRAYIEILRAGHRKNLVHGLIAVDVTDVRRRMRAVEARGEPLSFTAWVMHCVARAVDADRIVQAYRRRNRLILFRDVDVNTQIETEVEGQKAVKSLLVRAAQRKSVREITDEIRSGQRANTGVERYRGTMAFLSLPAFLRHVSWRFMLSNPFWFKRFGGTVGLSAVGMFGSGTGGWGIVMGPPTLMVVVGGLATEPRLVDGQPVNREFLHLTLSFDHDIVDGAPAARFAARLTELMEGAAGLTEP